MHAFKTLITPEEQAPIKPILESMNSALPEPGNGVVFAEFDEHGEVVAFQILQNAIMAEGLWARDHHTNLRRIWNMLISWMKGNGCVGRDLFVIASTPKIGKACESMGCEKMPWTIYRRQF